jgi:hypothetical protein
MRPRLFWPNFRQRLKIGLIGLLLRQNRSSMRALILPIIDSSRLLGKVA